MSLKSKNKPLCCVCYDPELDQIIYEAKVALDKLSLNRVRQLKYGYSCDKKAEEKIKKLQSYLNVLEDEHRKLILGAMPCLKCDKLQCLVEKTRKLTTSCDIEGRLDLLVDESMEELWIAQNPSCVSRETWERLAYLICGQLNLDIQVLFDSEEDCDINLEIFTSEEICDLTFEIIREVIPCDIMVALSVFKHNCDLNLKINRTEEECEIDFNILKSEIDCDLDFKAYRTLIDCNLSFDVIKAVYENGCTFSIGDPVTLNTGLNEYPLNKFNFTGIPNIQALRNLGVNVSESEYLKDPKKFIEKLNQDYN